MTQAPVTAADPIGTGCARPAADRSAGGGSRPPGGDFDSLLRCHLMALPSLPRDGSPDRDSLMSDAEAPPHPPGKWKKKAKGKAKNAKRQGRRKVKDADEWIAGLDFAATVDDAGLDKEDDDDSSLSYKVLPRPPDLLSPAPGDIPRRPGGAVASSSSGTAASSAFPPKEDLASGSFDDDAGMLSSQSDEEKESDDGALLPRPGGTCLQALDFRESESDSCNTRKRGGGSEKGGMRKKIMFKVVDPGELAKVALAKGHAFGKPAQAAGDAAEPTKRKKANKRLKRAGQSGSGLQGSRPRQRRVIVCRIYEKFRRCPRGDACPYLHQLPGTRSVSQPNEIVPE